MALYNGKIGVWDGSQTMWDLFHTDINAKNFLSYNSGILAMYAYLGYACAYPKYAYACFEYACAYAYVRMHL